MKILLFVCILIATVHFNYGKDSSCQTTDGGLGVCKRVTSCPNVISLVREMQTAPAHQKEGLNANIQALHKQCGFDGDKPMVCCSDCFTPDGISGHIRNIRQCPHLMRIYKTKKGLEFTKKSRLHSNSHTNLDVCCGPERPIADFPWENCDAQMTAFPPDPLSDCCGIDVHGASKIIGEYTCGVPYLNGEGLNLPVGPCSRGNTTAVDEYPWTVLLEYEQNGKIKLYCGGTLISNRYVITAAHCIQGEGAWAPVSVRLGEFDTENEGPDCQKMSDDDQLDCNVGAISVPIEKITTHEDYISDKKNDIALIRLKTRVRYTEFVRPLCLPSADVADSTGTVLLHVAGWGRVNSTLSRSRYKQAVEVPLVNLQQCTQSYAGLRAIPNLWDKQICAGGDPGKDSCNGDSGGPLMLLSARSTLVGVVSFGPHNCGSPGVPGVYTNVWQYKSWIWRNIRP